MRSSEAYEDLYGTLRDALLHDPLRELDYPRSARRTWTAEDVVADDAAGASSTTMADLIRIAAKAAKAGDREALAVIDGICARYAHANETERDEDLREAVADEALAAKYGFDWDRGVTA